MTLYLFFFFFSSRRRHTRSLRDWSSDVCSSDLTVAGPVAMRMLPFAKSHKSWHSALLDRKSTRLNSCHVEISYAVFCLKKKKKTTMPLTSEEYARKVASLAMRACQF